MMDSKLWTSATALLLVSMVQAGCNRQDIAPTTPSPDVPRERLSPTSHGEEDDAIQIAHTIVYEDRVYVLTEPMPRQLLPEAARDIPLMEAFAQLAIDQERPLASAVKLTVIGRSATCVVDATQEARSFLGCQHELDLDPASFTARRALIAEACPALRQPEEEWSLAWSLEGEHPEASFEIIEWLETDSEQQARLRELAAAYFLEHSLVEDIDDGWQLERRGRIPMMSAEVAIFGGEGFRQSLILEGDEVSGHLEAGLAPDRFLRLGARIFVEMLTSIETRNVYELRDSTLVPINRDGLYLFCGDGLL